MSVGKNSRPVGLLSDLGSEKLQLGFLVRNVLAYPVFRIRILSAIIEAELAPALDLLFQTATDRLLKLFTAHDVEAVEVPKVAFSPLALQTSTISSPQLGIPVTVNNEKNFIFQGHT
jgi:hypothetical protein